MAPHSSTLAWKIPWMEEPGGLQSMGSRRVRQGHNWATSLSLFTFMHWRRTWQLTPIIMPGESHGQRSLVGYSPQGHKESDTTEWLSIHAIQLWKKSFLRLFPISFKILNMEKIPPPELTQLSSHPAPFSCCGWVSILNPTNRTCM